MRFPCVVEGHGWLEEAVPPAAMLLKVLNRSVQIAWFQICVCVHRVFLVGLANTGRGLIGADAWLF